MFRKGIVSVKKPRRIPLEGTFELTVQLLLTGGNPMLRTLTLLALHIAPDYESRYKRN